MLKSEFLKTEETIRLHVADCFVQFLQLERNAGGMAGGFSDDETRLATENGFERVGLGSRIYRVETAATVIASIVSVGGLK
jgi:hypothetical protein